MSRESYFVGSSVYSRFGAGDLAEPLAVLYPRSVIADAQKLAAGSLRGEPSLRARSCLGLLQGDLESAGFWLKEDDARFRLGDRGSPRKAAVLANLPKASEVLRSIDQACTEAARTVSFAPALDTQAERLF